MKNSWIITAGIMLASLIAHAQEEILYVAEDFTEENLFTENIEGPAFDAAGKLFVVNFQNDGTVGWVKPDGQVELFLVLPKGSTANSIQFDKDNNMYLADFTGHQVLQVDMRSKKISTYVHSPEFNQPNDLCINSNGVLFASDPNWKEQTGQIWRIDRGGNAVLVQKNMGTTNGIELSPDDRILYVNESVQRKVWAFDVTPSGELTNKRLLIEFSDHGLDGMKCDKEGNLYITRYGKGTVVIVRPDGKLLREVELKGKNCSNLVFGGLDGKLVYVTLQDRKGMEIFYSAVAGKGY